MDPLAGKPTTISYVLRGILKIHSLPLDVKIEN